MVATLEVVIELLLQYGAPTMGCIMANAMFAAPVYDLRQSLLKGKLGDLNPFPWAMMSGNCLGWVVYGYYTRDPFVVAANMPALVLSLWLNSGAAKLQYYQLVQEHRDLLAVNGDADDDVDVENSAQNNQYDASPIPADDEDDGEVNEQSLAVTNRRQHRQRLSLRESFVTVPQELALLRVLGFWAIVLTYVGWFSTREPAHIVGVVVNINLVFFYAAPLQTMRTVIRERTSASIHLPTLFMNYTNTTFWILYGYSIPDLVIIVPNALGLTLGIIQGFLCLLYPRVRSSVLEPLTTETETLTEERNQNAESEDR